jgi:hypothetical protein
MEILASGIGSIFFVVVVIMTFFMKPLIYSIAFLVCANMSLLPLTAMAKPRSGDLPNTNSSNFRFNNGVAVNFKGCFQRNNNPDITCALDISTTKGEQRIRIRRDRYAKIDITDFNGKSVAPDNIIVANGGNCSSASKCYQYDIQAVEGATYQTFFVFKNPALSSSKIALFSAIIENNKVKVRNVSVVKLTDQ